MSARYILRFDDICPTMDWETWGEIEQVLTIAGVKPILAVVPDNKDPSLQVAPAREDFWERVRQWQRLGWTIGLHGYRHVYETDDPGVIGLNNRSEFAGLSASEQERKLRAGLEVFRREEVLPDIWVAPAHSFDDMTVVILRRLGIKTISDGFFLGPRKDADGSTWVPQQLWRLRPRLFGLWTVCYHHNNWTPADLDRFKADVAAYRSQIVGVRETLELFRGRRITWRDTLAARIMMGEIRVRDAAKRGRG